MATTYADVEKRRRAIPLGVIPYSQSTISPVTGRRADCSGLISYVWDLPTSGDGTWLKAYSTESLVRVGLIREIPRDELRPGDAIGFCGPGSANGGGGHIALFMAADGGRVRVWDHGSGMGPKDRWVTWTGKSTGWLAPGKCKAWRYVGIEEDYMTPAQEKLLVETAANVEALAGRVYAMTQGTEKVEWGSKRGEPAAIVRDLHELKAAVAELKARPAATVDVQALAAALLADPAFKAMLAQAAFDGAQRAERE